MYMIYGVSDCPHCLRAQALCMEKDFREKQKKLFKWKTYPIVTKLTEIGPMYDPDYIEDLVGGFDELQLELLSTEE